MDLANQLIPPAILLEEDDCEFFRIQLYQIAGITLTEKKRDLVQTRLRPRVHELGLKSFSDYRLLLEKLQPHHPEWQQFINRLTTNKTDFFREPKHFNHLLNKVLPDWRKKNADILKVWSAACSTGEEPYTLAMILHRALGENAYKIFASDIDSGVIRKATNAVYPINRVMNEVPEDYIHESFNFGRADLREWARISPLLKSRVHFFQHNLISAEIPLNEKPDVIFLRNVLIYFSPETIALAVENLYDAAAPGAVLYIGHSETLNGIKTQWKCTGPSIYQKK